MDFPAIYITKTPQETAQLGKRVAFDLNQNNYDQVRVVCLYGELGTGKTVFAGGFARGFGLKQRILSPTFLLMRTYPLTTGGSLYHLDLYRLNYANETKELGLAEIMGGKNNFVLIEWPELMGENLPEKRIDIYFRVLDDNKHEIQLCKN